MPPSIVFLVKGEESKKGHVCPPSTATHPEDRWETAFVYSFICKFTKLRQEIDGFESAMDLEEALLFSGPHPILEQILARFVLNLRPQTRNIGPEIISHTVASVFAERMSTSERTNFWDEKEMRNVDPFVGQDPNGYFALSWDLKLRILRQLVEWQLTSSLEIKGIIERGWGVVHMKHKKSNVEVTQEAQRLTENDPYSKGSLSMLPLGQDAKKKRYWAVDASPRLYVSTNPWKVTATFTKISTTKDEYLRVIEDLKQNGPVIKEGEKRTKSDAAHFTLIKALEDRVETIDHELQRVARARKKLIQRELAAAQVAEIRGPRTRRSTHRPDYVYHNGEDEEGEDDEFIDDEYQDPDRMDDEADFINDGPLSDEEYDSGYGRSRRPRRAAAAAGAERRRSTRTSVANANGTRNGSNNEWRGERRSSRLGASTDHILDLPPPAKRSRTSVSSATPSLHEEAMDVDRLPELPQKPAAPSLRPNEIVSASVPGKKKSKFWYYAVEPVPGVPLAPTDGPPNGPSTAGPSGLNGSNGNGGDATTSGSGTNGSTYAAAWIREQGSGDYSHSGSGSHE